MTVLQDDERLQDRARDLESKGLNGLRLAYVSLEPAVKPSFAWLDVEFWNRKALAPLPPTDAFVIRGSSRNRRGNPAREVKVEQVIASGGATLRLKVAPVGDYSTYVLSTTVGGLTSPDNTLPLAMDPLLNALPFKFRPGCFNLTCAPDWSASPAPPDEPAIDYLARDYDSFRHVLMSAMASRVPGWTPTSEADLDQVLIDLIAADADEQADFHDRVMSERSIATARKRVSIARHARLMDYHVHQGNQASTWLALKVNGIVDLPPTPDDEFGVWTGDDWKDSDAVIFAVPREGGARWRRRCYPALNELRLYTWSDTATALAVGSTEADLTGPSPLTTKAQAEDLRDFFLGTHPTQATDPGTEDVATSMDYLLIEEALNPETGAVNGRNVGRRQVLSLLPLKDSAGQPIKGTQPRAEAMQDPVTQEWFVRVRWLPEDALKQNYCFTTLCGDTWVVGVTKFHGNLTRITHGRPRITTFRAPPPRAPSYEGSDSSGLAAATEREFVATDEARYEIVNRQAASARPPRAVLCPLHRAPLAYRPTLPGGDRPPYTTLEVTVADPHHPAELWEERPDLIRSKGSDRHFIVETDEHGASVVRFGDGVNGQRPLVDEQSSPVDNPVVTCRYRLGQGVTGNVGADKLTGFDPKGGLVAEVWNPLDVLNGREPEPVREILRRAPECYRQRQRRAVTLDDYANRAREIAGVSGARARYAWTGSWRTVRVAIDPADTTVLRKELRRTIGAHLDALRLIGEDVEVRPAEYVPLDVRLRVCACQSYWPEDLRAALEMEFSDRWTPDGRLGFFHPNSWTFGQPLYASQLIGRALAVTGVERVVRLSVRRWNPGAGGGVTAIEVDPAALPDSAVEKLEIGPFEIIVLANDPDHLETGRMTFEILGGRR